MKSVAKYRRLAEEYRKLSAELTNPKDKEALQLMALRGTPLLRNARTVS
jgi:hypothetical protein